MKLLTRVLQTAVIGGLLALNSCASDEVDTQEAMQPSDMGGSGAPASPPSEGSQDAVEQGPVYFAFDSSELSASAQDILSRLAKQLMDRPTAAVQIEGHCDERGTTEYNLALGQRRADSVRRFLQTMGVSKDQLTTISYGEEKPVDPSRTEAAYAKNRRAELNISGA